MRHWQMFSAKACWTALDTSAVSCSPHIQCQTCNRVLHSAETCLQGAHPLQAKPKRDLVARPSAGKTEGIQQRRSTTAPSSLCSPGLRCFDSPLYTFQGVFYQDRASSIAAFGVAGLLRHKAHCNTVSNPLPSHMMDRILQSGYSGGSQQSDWSEQTCTASVQCSWQHRGHQPAAQQLHLFEYPSAHSKLSSRLQAK